MDERRVEFKFRAISDPRDVVLKEMPRDGKRRYLYGVSSGLKMDGAGERMTAKAIESFHRQAKEGNIKLFAGKHGVNFVDDIGLLVDSRINDDGDWETGFRLYDKDDFPETYKKVQDADTLWRQVKGLHPYTVPRKKGFSIEGVIPERGVVTMDATGKRVMDDIELDGVVVVTRPAYTDSMAKAVFKALDIPMPSDQRNALSKAIKGMREQDDYFSERMVLDSALETEIRSIVQKDLPSRGVALRTLFEGYTDLMVELILRSETVFKDATPEGSTGLARAVRTPAWSNLTAMKDVAKEIQGFLRTANLI